MRCGGETLTYGDLNAEANRLAHHLIAQGIGPETFVAVGIQRSPRLLVALLAIIKSGAAYLPVDPAYPADRIAFMVEDARPALVLTDNVTRGLFRSTARLGWSSTTS
ncbi:AMP-binding protein [Micromonospora sp. M12]